MSTKPTVIQTGCPRDCYEGCEIHATVENGRLTKMGGGHGNPYTHGVICQRVRRYDERVYSPERITVPMKKVNGEWVQINWEEAINQAATALQETIRSVGNLGILSYQSAGSMSGLKMLNRRFFNLLGGVTTTWGGLCGGAASAAKLYATGSAKIHDPLDIRNSKSVILWGRNPVNTSIHLLPIIKELREQGVPVVLIDPIHSDSAKFVDRVFQPVPGSDGFLAMAMAHYLIDNHLTDRKYIRSFTEDFDKFQLVLREHPFEFCVEQTGLPVEDIEYLARLVSDQKPASILLGYGMQRVVDGNEIMQLIYALGVISGNMSKPGGGVSHSTDEWRFFDSSVLAEDQIRFSRKVSVTLLGIDLQRCMHPPVMTVFIQGGNPIAQTPNSPSVIDAFKNMKHVILVDSYLTDTADFATLFLPTTTFVEEEDVMGSYGHPHLTYMRRVIDPVGESKTDLEILQLIAEKMGVRGMEGSVHDWIDRLLNPVNPCGINRQALEQNGSMRTDESPVAYPDGQFDTPSGKFRFIRKYDAYSHQHNAGYPLYFLTIAGNKAHNSQWLEKYQEGLPTAWVHPQNVSLGGVIEGEVVDLQSRVGTMRVVIRLDERQRKDIVLLYRGGWLKKGWGPNAITEPLMSREGGGAAYYSTRVKIVRNKEILIHE